jgi:micrococcal nuclease
MLKKFITILISSILLFVLIGCSTNSYKVTKVIDGDTIVVNNTTHIRLLLINTPELKSKQKYSKEAKSYLTKLVLNKKITIVIGSEEFDKYGRTLAYVYLGKTLINSSMIKSGYAKVAYTWNDVSRLNILQKQQDIAKSKKIGIWSIKGYATNYENTFDMNVVN